MDSFCCSKTDSSKEAPLSLIGFLVLMGCIKRHIVWLSFSKGEKSRPALIILFIISSIISLISLKFRF